jgi:hypothetical protein
MHCRTTSNFGSFLLDSPNRALPFLSTRSCLIRFFRDVHDYAGRRFGMLISCVSVPVSSQSTDFPNSRLIARSTAARPYLCVPAPRDQRSEIRDQRSEIRDQRSEIRDQRSEIRDQRSEIRETPATQPKARWAKGQFLISFFRRLECSHQPWDCHLLKDERVRPHFDLSS